MATRVTVTVPSHECTAGATERLHSAIAAATSVFHEVDRACTRFVPTSPLMESNRSPHRWHHVPETLFRAIAEAKQAHDITGGRFDPRVLRRLVALGYTRTLPFGNGDLSVRAEPLRGGHAASMPWRPRLRHASLEVLLGADPIDLGGIGKGLAVRWSSEILAKSVASFLVEAGGDCYCAGLADDDEPWRIAVEDPTGNLEPIAVLSVRDRAVTTSSTRLRRWVAGSRRVHHLIDPATGEPGGRGLVAVTVVGRDPARSEVWSKALFISGRSEIAAVAHRHAIAALWIDEEGSLAMSKAMERYVQWRRT
ncbi:MAG TPA: FAD:protein FMN transferase [Acidimicrobiales bacterium]|nr:FAD:protein FMN transferase [Acidimicrobiales bacterium]